MKPWWVQLSRYAAPHRRGLSLVTFLMFVNIVLDVLKPWPLKLIVDNVLAAESFPGVLSWIPALPGASSSTGLLAWLAGGTIILFAVRQLVEVTRGYAQTGVGTRMVYGLGAALFDHLQRLSISFHNRKQTGDLVRRVTTDSGCIRDLVTGVCLPLLTSSLTLIAMFAVMWRLDPFLSVIAILVIPLMGLLIRHYDRPMTESTWEHQQLEGDLMARAEQTMISLPAVHAFGREEYEEERFRVLSGQTLRAYVKSILAQMKFSTGVDGATALGTATVMAVGGLHVLSGSLTIGGLLVFLSYLLSLYAPLTTLAYLSTDFASSAASARRVLEVMDTSEGVQDRSGACALPVLDSGQRGHVIFENVTFGYDSDPAVLKDITLEIPPGTRVALVGKTGAGKSTLVSLIPRFYDPWKGRILFDEIDIRDVQISNLRSQVALVLQDPFLLPLSVAENIAYGRPGAKRNEIVTAARAANAEEFIDRLPDGFDTVIGERGSTLSGGEKQRIAIARALLKDAAVLILDEPTSALDAHTESLVMQALTRLMAGRTTFIIAHRFSTIEGADMVAVLENGTIVETGNHEDLIAIGGAYSRYIEAQFETILSK